MPAPKEPQAPRIEAGRYARIAEARERGLVVSAGQWAHWIEREGDEWVLLVESGAHAAVLEELAAFEKEERARTGSSATAPQEKIPVFSLYAAAWFLSAFFLLQQKVPPEWESRGVAESRAILAGEWWRTITALTLHADLSHLVANLATGILFAAFLIPRLGTGMAWLAVVLSGALGNAINAWGYRGESHASIGASTACFGALGILVGAELSARLREPHARSLWQLVLPVGAGLALLAYLGVGDEGKTVDYMAHCWGFLVGGAIGIAAMVARVKECAPMLFQYVAAALAPGLLILAWTIALR